MARQTNVTMLHLDHWVVRNAPTTRGSVIARVQIRTRQKLNRPLPSTEELWLSGKYYHLDTIQPYQLWTIRVKPDGLAKSVGRLG